MEITLPIRKPRENIIPWPPPEPFLRPALSGRPGPETIPNDIFIRIIQHTIDDITAFLERRDQAVCCIEVAKNAAPEPGYMDKFYIPWGGSTVEAVKGAFCDLLLVLQNPRPADTMLLSCVQNIMLRHIHYFNKEYSPLIEVLAAFTRPRNIQVILTAEDPRSVAPYSPSSRTFEPLPESHSHDKLEHIKCETPLDPNGLSY
ncbi:hypothetical protein COL922a_009573 [Colletotrichum nupharicola]|nr:hypothetical protein COL922a_009573 [Colletotrichum nupharicola]